LIFWLILSLDLLEFIIEKLIGLEGADSCGTSGQVRHSMARSGEWLTACPAESVHLKRKSTLLRFL
jgi:hypothetical protein